MYTSKPILSYKPSMLVFCISLLLFSSVFANTGKAAENTEVTSTRQQAIEFIEQVTKLDSSKYWPGIDPELFLKNVKANIYNPVSIYPGNGTYFCGYGALTYLFLQDDPLGYAKLLLQLYQDGRASFKKINFNPSAAVKKEAGQLKYKGILDIHPAEQMWFLTLAGHFKGYLNIFNRKYDPGDEDSFWASVNYAKFNRMAKNILNYRIKAKGSDIFHPGIDDLYEYMSERLKTGHVVLYINNRIVHKKNHVQIKLEVPTHFVVLERISKADGLINLVYWDYGGKTQIQLSPAFCKRIIYGITYLTQKSNDAE